jgi:hypothetical protein
MRVYLDLCCFNRPYDDQSQTRIRLETEAKLALQQNIRDGQCQLIWSAVMDFENAQSPFNEHQNAISAWRPLACESILVDNVVLELGRELMAHGLREFDALHVACAIHAGCEIFVTTDDRLIKKMQTRQDIQSMLPGDALAFLEKWYEN